MIDVSGRSICPSKVGMRILRNIFNNHTSIKITKKSHVKNLKPHISAVHNHA